MVPVTLIVIVAVLIYAVVRVILNQSYMLFQPGLTTYF